jgi:uncharacterized protein
MDFSIEFLVKNYQNNCIVSTERLVIPGHERLEAVLRKGTNGSGVVICHPHPQYGGSMHNGVVDAIEDGFSQSGFTTLKFNFRGVGGSTGFYSEGIGETDDVLDACMFLMQQLQEGGRFVLAGYSFGAWVAGKAVLALGEGVDLFFVAYPFSIYSPGELSAYKGRVYLVGGTYDDICPVDKLKTFHRSLPGESYLKIIPTSHFYEGREGDITDFITDTIGIKK